MTNLLVRSRSPTTLKDNDEFVYTESVAVKEEFIQIKKEIGKEDAASRTSTDDSMVDTTTTVSSRKGSERNPSHRSGRWTLDEKVLFLYGLQKFGKGRWKKMSVYLPNRSLVQIKSHAQKVLKRLDVGENVFRRLEDNSQRLESLVVNIHEQLGLESLPLTISASSSSSSLKEHQLQNLQTRRRPKKEQDQEDGGVDRIRPKEREQEDGIGDIDAASALCQLAAPAGAWGASDPSSAPPQNQHGVKVEFQPLVPASAICQLAAPAGAWSAPDPSSAPPQNQHGVKVEFQPLVPAVNWISS